jgi:hypothetical protein
MSVRLSARITASPNGRIFMKFDIADIHENKSRQSKFGLNRTKTSVNLHEDLRIFGCRRNEVAIKAFLTAIYIAQILRRNPLLPIARPGHPNAPQLQTVLALLVLFQTLDCACVRTAE